MMTPPQHTTWARVILGAACLAVALVSLVMPYERAQATETIAFKEPQGRQLNADPISLNAAGGIPYIQRWFAVRWDDVKEEGVAVVFLGEAPALVLASAKRGDWVDVHPSAVSQACATGEQVAVYSPAAIEAALSSEGRDTSWVGTLMPRVYDQDATVVKRIVAVGAVPLPKATAEGYAVPAKLLYTRPVTLAKREAGDNDYTKSVNIDLSNPDVPGHDLVVRYTGDDPQLIITNINDDKVNNKSTWTGYSVADPHVVSYVAGAAEGSSQKVAYFRAADLDAVWALDEQVTNKDMTYNSTMISVRNTDPCQLVELVTLGVDERVRPTMRTGTLTGPQIVRDLYAGFNFGGSLESFLRPDDYPEGSEFTGMTPVTASKKDGGWLRADLDAEISWGNPYLTNEMFAAVKDKGFKAVRVPVTWCQHLIDADNDGNAYEIDRAWMARVHEVVDYALNNDLYVIINLHHENWIDRSDIGQTYNEIAPKFKAVWGQIAEEFAGYDQRLIFESMNEPHAAGDKSGNGMHEWDEPTADDLNTVNRLNQDFVSLIRSRGTTSDKTRMLLLSVYGGHPELRVIGGIWAPLPSEDSYVAVSVHPYTPYSYVEGEPGTDKKYTGQHQATLANVFAGIRSTFTDKGILVVADEYGCRQHANTHDIRKWSYEYATYAKELGIPTFQWFLSTSGYPPFFDRRTLTWNDEATNPILQPLFEVLADEGIAWGGREHIEASEHESMDAGGKELLAGLPKTLTPDAGFSDRFELTTGGVQGKELAVRFSGGTPYLLLLTADNTGNWWGIAPTSIDAQAHIAYFSGKDIRAASENDPNDSGNNVGGRENLAYGRFRVRDETVTLESVRLLDQKSDLWEEWHDATPVYCTDEPGETRSLMDDKGAIVTIQTIATGEAKAHKMGAWVQVSAPTTTQKGEEKRSCAQCPYEETRELPALDDKDKDTGKQADEKPAERDEKPAERDEKPTQRDDEPAEQDEKPTQRDDGQAERDEKPTQRDDEPAEQDEKPTQRDDEPAERDDGQAERGEKPTQQDDELAEWDSAPSKPGAGQPSQEEDSEQPKQGGESAEKDSEQPRQDDEQPAGSDEEPAKTNGDARHPYDIIHRDNNGVWDASSGTEYVVSSNADFSKFVDVLVDGVVVERTHYSARSGSTVVTLSAAYLATLSPGRHTVTIRSTDGEASTEFVVRTAPRYTKAQPVMARTGTVGTSPREARAATPSTTDEAPNPVRLALAGIVILLAASCYARVTTKRGALDER